jgi:hypothetical protein
MALLKNNKELSIGYGEVKKFVKSLKKAIIEYGKKRHIGK